MDLEFFQTYLRLWFLKTWYKAISLTSYISTSDIAYLIRELTSVLLNMNHWVHGMQKVELLQKETGQNHRDYTICSFESLFRELVPDS